ncbi:MAG: Maf family protein [Filomicrobium sp.]
MASSPHIILASGSHARHDMLKAAGIAFTVVPADIDEDTVRATLTADDGEIDAADVAEILARAKGEAVSTIESDSLVIAADQTLSMNNEIFSKPANLEEARETLVRLRGQEHFLHSAVVLAEDGEVTWSYVETARLKMRQFSSDYLTEYLVRAGRDVCQSVGAYQIEGLGLQLFEELDGDFFTILGMPMLPLLKELRRRNAIAG